MLYNDLNSWMEYRHVVYSLFLLKHTLHLFIMICFSSSLPMNLNSEVYFLDI